MRNQPMSSVARRAFTIAELMIVLIILGVVLSVILPSLKSVSARAKAAVTATTMSSLAQACGGFTYDNNGRSPGYFTAAEMGHPDNEAVGMPGMSNILLDLMPGVTQKVATPGAAIYEVGPSTDAKVSVDLTQYGGTVIAAPGGTNRSYFRPDPKYFYAPVEPGGNLASVQGTVQASTREGNLYLPSLHDAYGTPILAWQEDERVSSAFVRPTYDANDAANATVARFYWASNAAFLKATSTGRLLINQNQFSMLGEAAFGAGSKHLSLIGLLANPAFPENFANPKARGPIVFHSAGANGVYLGIEERGAKTSIVNNNQAPLGFRPGYDPFRSGDFDDLVVSSGN